MDLEVEASRKARDEPTNYLPSMAGRPEAMPCLGNRAISTSRGKKKRVLDKENHTVMSGGNIMVRDGWSCKFASAEISSVMGRPPTVVNHPGRNGAKAPVVVETVLADGRLLNPDIPT